jgi:hypothetical protein
MYQRGPILNQYCCQRQLYSDDFAILMTLGKKQHNVRLDFQKKEGSDADKREASRDTRLSCL